MERKRKLPPRAAARVEHAAKKRNITPRERSATPATPQPVEETPPPPPPPPSLPTSIQSGKPLPTVEEAQASDLGVLLESLSRSRHRWITDGLFEKYYTKPHKRKGVVIEDPKNPPKDSMTRVGPVTITLEPHVIEATMWVVKESKVRPQQPQPQSQVRPIIQYGPPNGSMKPPPTSSSTPATPSVTAAATSSSQTPAQPSPKLPQDPSGQSTGSPRPEPIPAATANHHAASSASPLSTPKAQGPVGPLAQPQRGIVPSVSSPAVPSPSHAIPRATPPTLATPSAPTLAHPGPAGSNVSQPPSNPPLKTAMPILPTSAAANLGAPRPPAPATPTQAPSLANSGGPSAPPAPAARTAVNDPVIALLAQRAADEPQLRDLMKRVAVGQAKEGELAHFQKIIDQLNAEYKSKGGQQGPSADRLSVDGRTVKYFADEVRMILDIVLTSNPNQRSAELRPPAGVDSLVVMLVKTALEDQKTKDMVRRIAEGRPGFTDATDLKDVLERLNEERRRNAQKASVPPTPSSTKAVQNGPSNGHVKTPVSQSAQPNPQALRSKGPPPAPKPDVSAVLFDFGSGDRYLFPKYSILEYQPAAPGQQVVVSFLLVRKGSMSEYGGDPKLDYYQPVTIRISTSTGRHLENLARVVAPQDEVRRYMDDVMDNMTRAEYVLLAMRLPRVHKEGDNDGANEEPKAEGRSSKEIGTEPNGVVSKPPVLWTTKAGRTSDSPQPLKARSAEDEGEIRYRKLIKSVTVHDGEVV
ncbi:hypothetical protein S7711_01146 [Stachybotrys chartarum IBT 7711]|uniref:SWR1-complex protein 3 domain-containing protein n=1 Tax=Stachybotrys chartarum (strain CBS 109288 / IBT 7711) TaxID=1280523 RepID=A0A084AST9_STACB|nr:hypothetical protein S7711_01146 [Stachybotrys chartarum IBT 7711]